MHFQLVDFCITSNENNVENGISVQSYVDPCIFRPHPHIFFDFPKIAQERYTQPAVREIPKYILNDNLKVVIIIFFTFVVFYPYVDFRYIAVILQSPMSFFAM